MRPLRCALPAILILLPLSAGIAAGQASDPPGAPARIPQTLNQPLMLTPFGGGTRSGMEPAPIPNREIEPPRNRFAEPLSPGLEPLMLPPERRQGATFGGEHLRETGPDRPFDNVLPGARLRIPFEGTGGR